MDSFARIAEERIARAIEAGEFDNLKGAGMTITEARKVRINFTIPYLKSGLVAAVRASDESKYTTADSIIRSHAFVG